MDPLGQSAARQQYRDVELGPPSTQQDSGTAWQQDSTTAWQPHEIEAMRQQEEDSLIWQHRHTQHWQQLQQRYWQTGHQQEQQRRWQQQQRQVVQQQVAGQQRQGEGRREAVKRSCSSLQSGDGGEDSDEEALPSSKRQRVSVSAMEQLFAACSLGGGRARGEGGCHQARATAGTGEGNDTRTRRKEAGQRGQFDDHAWPTGAITANGVNQEAQFKSRGAGTGRVENTSQRVPSPLENSTDQVPGPDDSAIPLISTQNKDGDNDGSPTTEHEADSRAADDDGRGMTAFNDSSSEDSSTEEAGLASGQEEDECPSNGAVKEKRAVGRGKRSAEDEEERGVQHSSEEEVHHLSKRVRKLKRGLRLCSNITCYIEQVLYNC